MRARTLLPLLLLLPGCGAGDNGVPRAAFATGARAFDAAPADTAPTVTRRVWADSAAFDAVLVAPTPDGGTIVLTEWMAGDIAALTLGTGELRNLTQNPTPYEPGFGMVPRVSPAGDQVAFGWWNVDDPERWQIRTVPLAGGEPVVVHASPATLYAQPEDWSADGRTILAWRQQEDMTTQILMIAADGGGERIIKTLDWRTPTRMSLSPDGRWIAYDLPPEEERAERDVYLLATDGSREIHLIDHPANDKVLGWSPDGGHLLVASDRTGTPGAWLFRVSAGRVQGAPTLVKPDMWQATGVGFTPDGRFFYGVETGSREIYVTSLDSESGQPIGSPTRATMRSAGRSVSPTWSPDGRHIAYVTLRAAAGGTVTLTMRSLESGEVREFGIPPRLNYPQGLRWAADGRSILFSARERSPRAAIFRLDLHSGEVERVLDAGDANILAHDVSRDGRTLVYLTGEASGSGASSEERTLVARDLATGEERVLHRLRADFREAQLRQVAISHDGRSVAFVHWRGQQDPADLLIVPLSGGEPRKLATGKGFGGLAFDPADTHLLFVRATEDDATDQINALYRVPVEGGEAEALGLTDSRLGDLQVHPQSRRLVYASGFPESELWVMEGFLPSTGGSSTASGQ